MGCYSGDRTMVVVLDHPGNSGHDENHSLSGYIMRLIYRTPDGLDVEHQRGLRLTQFCPGS